VATVVYDGTVSFCNRFVDKRSRTHDQMVQAARSGNKNIAEGSRAAATTSQTELRLVNVARASLEELLDQQISALEHDFVREGGYSERLAAARIAERQKQRPGPGATVPGAPGCPRCGKPMALRTARKGARAGSQFWGCSGYPQCKGVRGL
jgi:four helix bundle suffix protein